MDGETMVVLLFGLCVVALLSICFIIYNEDINQSELETCMENCNNIVDNSDGLTCKLHCIDNIHNASEEGG